MAIRNPTFAGSFYPGNPDVLRKTIGDSLKQDITMPDGDIFGAVAPHAGYQYSGSVAALSHLAYKDKDLDRILLIGPSHQGIFKNAVVDNRRAWGTPLGETEIDKKAVETLTAQGIDAKPELFDQEHSLEVQLPFIQDIKPEAKIVPIMLGDQKIDNARKVGEAISKLPGKTFIIASSDLYHGYSYETCKATDKRTIGLIAELDSEKFCDNLATGQAMACGGGPITALIHYGTSIGCKKAEVLSYTNSNDVMGVTGGYVVGYVSIVFIK